jgi:multisubunit Na+/H+ antiporter MnhC subunit
MNTTTLMLSLLFSCVGLAFFLYGRKTTRMVPIGAGVALMICPYFISNVVALLVVGLILTAMPFVWRGE